MAPTLSTPHHSKIFSMAFRAYTFNQEDAECRSQWIQRFTIGSPLRLFFVTPFRRHSPLFHCGRSSRSDLREFSFHYRHLVATVAVSLFCANKWHLPLLRPSALPQPFKISFLLLASLLLRAGVPPSRSCQREMNKLGPMRLRRKTSHVQLVAICALCWLT